MNNRYGPSELIEAAVEAHRWRNAHPDLRDYVSLKYALLRDQLDVPFDLVGQVDSRYKLESVGQQGPDRGTRQLQYLLVTVIASITEIPDPFGSFLEAPPSIIELYQSDGPGIRDAGVELRSRLDQLALRILEHLVPAIRDRATSFEALTAAGLPGIAPDPFDYW